MSDRVICSIEGGVADVRLNRADKLNALDDGMFTGLIDTGAALAADPSVRAVVVSGEGRGFCAGLDFSGFQGMAQAAGAAKAGDDSGGARGLLSRDASSIANRAQRAAWVWQEVPVPVIAAVHGVVFGGGLQIALGADIRFAHPESRLSIMEIKWGIIPDMSGTQTLRRLLPLDLLKELTWTGREVLGPEAKELGLVTHLAEDPRAAALELARTIAGKSPHAIRAGKALMNESGLGTIEEGLKLEERTQLELIGSPNQIESVKANLEKRAPNYRDPDPEA